MSSEMAASAPAPETRAKVFLSYSTKDAALAERLLERIKDNEIACFYAPLSIDPLREWRLELEDNIRRANLFLLLYTANSAQSEEVQKEVEQADKLGKEIWAVRDISATVTPVFQKYSFMDRQAFLLHAAEETQCIEKVLTEIDKLFPKPGHRGEIAPANCPFPGPQPFSARFDNVFFGRREAIAQLKQAIDGDKPVLLVHGPSGAGKTSLLAVGLGKELRPRSFYSDPINGSTAYELLRGVLARLLGSEQSASEASNQDIVQEILKAIHLGNPNRYVLCFDQMENFFTESAPIEQINVFLGAIETILDQAGRTVTVLVSFRQEFFTEVQLHINNYFPGNWGQLRIRKLSALDAQQCMSEPASLRGVKFDEKLAEALVEALVKGQDTAEPTVNPMDIQKVCIRLWEGIAALEGGPHWRIDGTRLAVLAGPQTNPQRFVDRVLADYLNERVRKIAARLPASVAGPNPKAFVELSLMEFVGPEKVRQRVPEKVGEDGNRLVGKLTLDVVKELVNSGLVQSCGNKSYELSHDSLAVEIANYGETSPSVFAVKSLDSALSRKSKERGAFNQHSELLENLEAVRENKWLFRENETEFLVRCALGDKRRNTKGTTISLDAWAQMLADKSPDRLVRVLEDGLGDAEESVQVDVMGLLLKPEVRSRIGKEALEKLGIQIQGLSMNDQRSQEVREKACALLVNLGYEPGIAALFDCVDNSSKRREAATALALVRHAIDTLQGTSTTFETRWKSLGRWKRLRVFKELFRWRWSQGSWWIFYILSASAPLTAVGAIIPFIPLGHFGASLTMNSTNFGEMAGIFHGATGGVIWGLGVAAALLGYCVIWRGGRIRNTAREAIAMSLWGSVGGLVAGMGNCLVIALVFEPGGLRHGGWLALHPQGGQLHQVFLETLHGWIMPVFGAALGLGIGWSLSRILADPEEHWIARRSTPPTGASQAPSAEIEVRRSLKRIVRRILRESWRNAIWLAIGAIVVFFVIRPGSGVCDPSSAVAHLSGLPAGCEPKFQLPPKWVRTAGLAVVILGGSLFFEIGFLFSLLTVQFGLDFKRTLKENRYFLRSAGATDGPHVTGPPRIPASA